MKNEDAVSLLADAIRSHPPQPRQDNKSILWAVVGGAATLVIGGIITVIGGLVVAVIGGVAMVYLTQTLDKADSSSLSMATVTTQIATITKGLDGVEMQVVSLRSDLAKARVNPFTSLDGIALERRLQEDIQEEVQRPLQEINDIKDRLRILEASP